MRCSKCGAEIRGIAVLCETCGAGPEQPVEQPRVSGENVALGIVGALAGGAVGVAAIFLLYVIGMYAAIGGFALAFCTLKGYELLARGMSVRGIVICVAVIAVMPFVADVLGWGFVIMQSWEVEISFVDAVRLLPVLLKEGAIIPGGFVQSLLMLYGFTALGAVTVVLDTWKKIRK